MLESLFSKEKVNKGRQPELDLLKGYSIIMMVITHCIDELFNPGYLEHLPSYIIEDVLSQSIGATSFMICMGIGIIYSRHASVEEYARRGVSLLLTGQVLNIVRNGIVPIIIYHISGDTKLRAWVMLVFSSDILQFAGLFFLCMALFKKLKLKNWQIFLVSVIVNIVFMPLRMKLNTGIYGIDQFIGLFVFNNSESYFPLFHWMIYPAFGMVFGDVLTYVKDKKKFYGVLLIPTLIIWVAYYGIGIFVDQPFFTVFKDWVTFCGVGIFDALASCISDVSQLSILFFLSLLIPETLMRPIGYMSKGINRFYCVHAVIVPTLMYIYESVIHLEVNAAICYGSALFVIVVTTVIVIIYDKYMAKTTAAIISKRRYFWYTLVIVISIVLCIWSSLGGVEQYPNIHNDYEAIVSKQ